VRREKKGVGIKPNHLRQISLRRIGKTGLWGEIGKSLIKKGKEKRRGVAKRRVTRSGHSRPILGGLDFRPATKGSSGQLDPDEGKRGDDGEK